MCNNMNRPPLIFITLHIYIFMLFLLMFILLGHIFLLMFSYLFFVLLTFLRFSKVETVMSATSLRDQ